MATFFEIRTKKEKGNATLFVRCQSKVFGINDKMATGLEVDIKAWNKSKKSATTRQNYLDANPELADKMNAIRRGLDLALQRDTALTME